MKRKDIPNWVVLAFVILSIGFFIFERNVPVFEKGHRVFAVPNDDAVKALVEITAMHGLKENFTFNGGTNQQTLLTDNATVFIKHDPSVTGILSGLSLPSGDPIESARKAQEILTSQGFTAIVTPEEIPTNSGLVTFCFLESDACIGWKILFRPHAMDLGTPPGKTKLTN